VSGLIDWTRMRLAEPAYDVGATIALLTQGPLRAPAGLGPVLRAGRRLLVAAYLADYRRRRSLDGARLRYCEALRTLLFLLEAGEHRLADLGRRARPEKPTAFGEAGAIARSAARFESITGVRLRLP
jgi:aminoglycoside phosphotransferase (APT) family kinase protein